MMRIQFGIRELLWVTGAVALTAAIIRWELRSALFLIPAWIAFAIAITTRSLGWTTRSTLLANFVTLDLIGASLMAYAGWVVNQRPQDYPAAILLGGPTEAFLIGLAFLAPLAAAYAFVSCYAFALVDPVP
jgi:hypothetical protein